MKAAEGPRAKKRQFCQQLLAALDKAAAGTHPPAAETHFEDFQVLEYLLTALHAPGADNIAAAQAKMAPADIARWQAARSVMFSRVIPHLQVSPS